MLHVLTSAANHGDSTPLGLLAIIAAVMVVAVLVFVPVMMRREALEARREEAGQ